MRISGTIVLCAALAACGSNRLAAPAQSAIEQSAMLDRLARALEDRYLVPEAGARYAHYVRTQGLQHVEPDGDAAQFAADLTAALKRVHPDDHLRVVPPSNGALSAQSSSAEWPESAALEASERLTPEVAYLRFNLFPGDEETLAALTQQLDLYAGVGTLIVDVRGHLGGGFAEMDLLFAELFLEPTLLVNMDTRAAVEEDGSWPNFDGPTMRRIPSPASQVRREHVSVPASPPRYVDTRVYLLMSEYTASAAEHLALVLKRTKRGVLVGEATRGGAHFGGTVDLGGGYAAFIPVGRTYDPDTGKDWEGSGVAPDVAVDAGEALVAALGRSGVPAVDAEAIDRRLDFTPPELPQ